MTSSPPSTTAEPTAVSPRLSDAADESRLARGTVKRQSEWRRSWNRFKAYRPAVIGLTIVGLLVLIAIFAPLIAPYDPYDTNPRLRGDPPRAGYWFGNDSTGRDILSRVIYGSRIALQVGLGATAIAVTIGVTIGAAAGYFGGKVDMLLSRIIDTLMAFPTIALLMVLGAVLEPSLINVIIAIGTTVWASYARIVRADVLSLRERDFILAAKASGASSSRIIFRHLIPNVLGPIVVLASLAIGGVIIYESALSFLGLGVRPPEPSWGRMLADGRDYLRDYPHMALAPGLAITITVLAFNFVGDGLRDALDPRGRR